MWKSLSEQQRQSAHEHAIDQCLHIDDKVERKTAIAREAVNTGASAALDMASQWLAAQSPVLHEKFLQEFGQGAGVETSGNVSGLTAAEERDQLAAAIRDAAVRVGICRADACLTGPHLLMLCNDLATAATAGAVRDAMPSWELLRDHLATFVDGACCNPGNAGMNVDDWVTKLDEMVARRKNGPLAQVRRMLLAAPQTKGNHETL